MKVLLDEMLPAGVAGLLPDHEVTTAQQAAWGSRKAIASRATASGYGGARTRRPLCAGPQNVTASGSLWSNARGSRKSEVAGFRPWEIQAAVAGARAGDGHARSLGDPVGDPVLAPSGRGMPGAV